VFKKNLFLLLSILLHLIVMYVVAQSIIFPTISGTPQKNLNIIQATLIFDLLTPIPEIPVDIIKEEIPLSTEPQEAISISETLEKNLVESDSKLKIPTGPVLSQALPTNDQNELKEELQKKSEQGDNVDTKTFTDKNMPPTAGLEVLTPTTNMARRHLKSFQQQQQNRLAEQASQYYQQRKNSPVINTDIKEPFMSEGEKFKDNLKIRANCSSSTKKTTVVLLSIFGGNIDCSKQPTIEGFIQNRINKKSDLSERYQHTEQKIPQSVVIKKPVVIKKRP
jgi:hypothetical protein